VLTRRHTNTLCNFNSIKAAVNSHVREALLVPTAKCLVVQPSSQLNTATVGSIQCYRGRHSVRCHSVQPLHHPKAATSRCCIVGLLVYGVPEHQQQQQQQCECEQVCCRCACCMRAAAVLSIQCWRAGAIFAMVEDARVHWYYTVYSQCAHAKSSSQASRH
jgi:hypothetical protein